MVADQLRTRRSLSARVTVLILSVLLLVEGLTFLNGLSRERISWLDGELRNAAIAAVAADGIDPVRQRSLLEMMGAEGLRATRGDGSVLTLVSHGAFRPGKLVDLDGESWTESLSRAVGSLVRRDHRRLEVLGPPSEDGTRIRVIVLQRSLTTFLRQFAKRFLLVSVLIASVTGALLVISLRALVLLPMRRITSSIMGFRRDPERAQLLDETGSLGRDDEIALVGRELAAMQAELRTALWRNARLAAVGTAVAKMSHDLRGILSSALLVADRLTMNADEPVRHAGEVIVHAVHRATALAQQTLDFVREGPPALRREKTPLRGLVDDAGAALAEPGRNAILRNEVGMEMNADVDRESLLRVLANLFRNAAQAGAGEVTVVGTGLGAATVLTVTDDGPGLPEALREKLFRPFVGSLRAGGSGLGLAIARDLMRAHGGDLTLEKTGPAGTSFVLSLQQPRREQGKGRLD